MAQNQSTLYTCVMASPLCCTSDAPAFRNQKPSQKSEVHQTICKSKAWPWGHWCIITFPQSSLPQSETPVHSPVPRLSLLLSQKSLRMRLHIQVLFCSSTCLLQILKLRCLDMLQRSTLYWQTCSRWKKINVMISITFTLGLPSTANEAWYWCPAHWVTLRSVIWQADVIISKPCSQTPILRNMKIEVVQAWRVSHVSSVKSRKLVERP